MTNATLTNHDEIKTSMKYDTLMKIWMNDTHCEDCFDLIQGVKLYKRDEDNYRLVYCSLQCKYTPSN